jgi:ribonuclease BN (tRNA processing enzyme)
MELTVLGCSGSGPAPDSPASGYLVRAGDRTLVLDLGNGTLGALQRHLDPFDLDALLLSHLHPDHCADVASLVVFRRYHPRPPFDVTEHRLPLYAPREAPDRLASQYATSAAELAVTDLSDSLDFRVVTDGMRVEVAGCVVRTRRMDHVCEAYGLRLEHEGRSLVYSGDTGPCEGLVELASGADVLLCEASWPHIWPGSADPPPPGVHMSGRQAGEHAAGAGVGQLLITHVPAWFDGDELVAEAKDVFAGPVELVRAGGVYQV